MDHASETDPLTPPEDTSRGASPEEPSEEPWWTLPPFVFSPIRPGPPAGQGTETGAGEASPKEEASGSERIPEPGLTAPQGAESIPALREGDSSPREEVVIGGARVQETVDQLAVSLASLEERLAELAAAIPEPKSTTLEVLAPPAGEVVEVPIKLRVETEDSRQLALLQELHKQREQLQKELAEAHRQIQRLGKTQFKSSNVMEALRKSTDETIAELRAALEARDQELAELRNLAEEVRKEYRAYLAQELLRVVDGLERSLQEAEHLRASWEVSSDDLQTAGWWSRWRSRRARRAMEFIPERQAAMGSWQEGLSFVLQRLLGLLAEIGVEPLTALGQPFDPHRHVAVGRVSDPQQPDNTVVEEPLKGYLMGDRILRFAEVVVNKVDSGEGLET